MPGGLKDARHLGFGDQARELRQGRLWKGQQVGNEGDRMISSVEQKPVPNEPLSSSTHCRAKMAQPLLYWTVSYTMPNQS